MARGVSLADLVQKLKAEIGYSQDISIVSDAELKNLLSNKQQWLSTEFDFPFLEQRWDLNVQPSSRYLQLPTIAGGPTSDVVAINFERPVLVEVFYNNLWEPVLEGIGSQEYNYLNSDQGIGLDPIMRWRMASDTSDVPANSIEIWPMPQTPQIIRFTGQRVVSFLQGDTDLCDLDDMMLVYFVAGEKLTRLNQADAQLKLAQANRRLLQTKATYPKRDCTVVLGRNAMNGGHWQKNVPLVVVAGGRTSGGNTPQQGGLIIGPGGIPVVGP